jgi:hypothetical protein
VVRRPAATWVLALVALALPARAQPVLEVDAADRLLLTRPPPVLLDARVKRHLTTGLTVTLAFRVEVPAAGGKERVGNARVDVRFELWDEVFHLQRSDLEVRDEPALAPSLEELERWWRNLRLPILDLGAVRTRATRARVILDVIPFSRAEQLDAQRWLEESLRRAGTGGDGSRAAEGGEESLDRVVGVLLATSIRRQALTTFRWNVPLPERSTP